MKIRFEYIKNNKVIETFIVDCYNYDEVQEEIESAKEFIEFDNCVVTKIIELAKNDFYQEYKWKTI